jgi:hypothetical protein
LPPSSPSYSSSTLYFQLRFSLFVSHLHSAPEPLLLLSLFSHDPFIGHTRRHLPIHHYHRRCFTLSSSFPAGPLHAYPSASLCPHIHDFMFRVLPMFEFSVFSFHHGFSLQLHLSSDCNYCPLMPSTTIALMNPNPRSRFPLPRHYYSHHHNHCTTCSVSSRLVYIICILVLNWLM